MKNYELLCVLPGTLGEDEIQPIAAEVNTILTTVGATSISSEDRGKTRLAYPIKHIRYGYFILFTFEAEPAMVPQMQAKFRLVNNLLRAMINEFDPEMRKEKDITLAKIAVERAEYEKTRAEAEEKEEASRTRVKTPAAPAPIPVSAPVAAAPVETAEDTEEKPVKRTKKASTDKPTEENMTDIEKKLDKVLDSSLEV